MKRLFTILIGLFFTIKVGQEINIGNNYKGENVRLMYTGMISNDTYSIKSPQYRSSVNIFYPTWVKVFNHRHVWIKVIYVHPDEIKVERQN